MEITQFTLTYDHSQMRNHIDCIRVKIEIDKLIYM